MPLPQGSPLDVFVGPVKSMIADAIYWMNLGKPTAVSQSVINRLELNTIQQKNGAIMLGLYGIATGVRLKPIGLPAWRTLGVDIEHILSGHTVDGARVISGKTGDLFPAGMSAPQILRAIKEAYSVAKKLRSQEDRVLVEGVTGAGMRIRMWVNTTTRTVESAYPKW
jgi:hypothetical protein